MAVVMVVPVPFQVLPMSLVEKSQVRRIPGYIIYPIGLDAKTDGFPVDFLNGMQLSFPHCHWLYHHVCMPFFP